MKQVMLVFASLLFIACYQPVEHSTVAMCGVVKLRVSDNSVAGILQDVPEGRALLSTGNTEFLVASGTGEIVVVSSPEMEIDTSFSVGYPGGAGYRSIIMPTAGTVYLTSSVGDMLEVNLEELSVTDQFPVGDLPDQLAQLPYSGEFFYVSDGSTGRISEVRALNNTVVRQSDPLGAVPSSITAESYLNAFLISVTSEENGLCGILDLGTFHFEEVYLGLPCHDVSAFPAESIWVVTHPEWNNDNGSVSICTNYSFPEVEAVQVTGHPMQICSVPGTTMFYLLSYLGNGESLLVGINYLTRRVEAEVPVDGYPWDITSHGNGEFVLALTAEL